MNATRYFGEANYKRWKHNIETDKKYVVHYFEVPSYMTPTPTTFPKAEIGLCCPDRNEPWHPYLSFITHNLP